MLFVITLTKQAIKDLESLDASVTKRIVAKLKMYSKADNPMQFAKSLSGSFQGLYRFRIGDYRVIFDRNDKGECTILLILQIDHRKDIYN